ncbi:hypothetical protein E2P84_02375 [Burkholderia cepacia]|uniref:Uncharacterized protein n=1 Tax=Burkholderia cepacia TaxID=292 RepID=A0AAX2RRW6_BURCE|nr:hypothetical protein E2P84_02375 [Burkholderia cepacia]TET05025.1 hypothetical protein E3D36_02405 [Burkholderia cepacia]TEU46850.1 hypothetical protein E3D39_07625 [Burkholderia cepacia]TEU48015.1 hypothetical protein E3D37_15140 [Burkholderia cepacia]TEU57028.1 hypothetical protein E3D38_04405 [Burkholderia cepacia]
MGAIDRKAGFPPFSLGKRATNDQVFSSTSTAQSPNFAPVLSTKRPGGYTTRRASVVRLGLVVHGFDASCTERGRVDARRLCAMPEKNC